MIRRLVMLATLAFVTMVTAKPLPQHEVAEIRAWHAKLVLPPLKDLPFVWPRLDLAATLVCDDPVNPREELLKDFERIVENCPKGRHAARAKEVAGVLKRMIAEDQTHAAERAKVPFERLSRADQIKDLIFQLRDQDGGQFSQPGSCSIFDWDEDGKTPADRLVDFGFETVQALLGESVHSAGYGGGLSKEDPKESEELRAGVDKAVAAEATVPYEVRWKLADWWHDDE